MERFGSSSRRVLQVLGRVERPLVARRVVGKHRGGQLAEYEAAGLVQDAQLAAFGDGSHDARPDLPSRAYLSDGVEIVGLDYREHALLALRRHDLERRHGRLPQGHSGYVHVHPVPGARRRLGGRAREPGAAEVLYPSNEAEVEQLQRGLDQSLLLERIADLDARPLRVVGLIAYESRRCEDAHSADPVPAGRGAEQHRQVSDPRRRPQHQAVDGQEPKAQHVHERVAGVALVDGELPSDRRDSDGVAVAGDPTDHPVEQPPVLRVVERAEAEWVHQRDRPGAHREYVADYPAHPGRGTLVRLHGRRVVMALDANCGGDAVADVDYTGILAGPNQNSGPLGRKAAKVDPRGLVGAVLTPHDRDHRELERVGLAT